MFAQARADQAHHERTISRLAQCCFPTYPSSAKCTGTSYLGDNCCSVGAVSAVDFSFLVIHHHGPLLANHFSEKANKHVSLDKARPRGKPLPIPRSLLLPLFLFISFALFVFAVGGWPRRGIVVLCDSGGEDTDLERLFLLATH